MYNYGSDILKCILSFMISCKNLNSLWLKFLYSLKSKSKKKQFKHHIIMVDQSVQLCIDQLIELCNLIITVDQQLDDNNKSSFWW